MRRRDFNTGIFGGNYYVNGSLDHQVFLSTKSGYEITVLGDVGHYGWPRPPVPNVGGAFLQNYHFQEQGTVNVGHICGGSVFYNHTYNGSVGTSTFYPSYLVPEPNGQDASGYGAELWSKLKPDKPSLSGLNAIYELKDLPGMLKDRFLTGPGLHKIGDYYLALKFGWEPLLRDIRDFVITHINAQRTLEQLIRDEGKPVKRHIRLFSNHTDVARGAGNNAFLGPQFVTYFYGEPHGYDNVVYKTDEVWASARFRYWLPPGPRNVNWTNSMKAKIFGFKPTPKVVWNAIPWSWLIDWFSHVGYLIDNLDTSLVDRLAADYFYCMRKSETVGTNSVYTTYFRYPQNTPFTVTAEGREVSGSKTRVSGDPFGWATPEGSLSGVQLSILGALGLSRLR